MSEIYRALYFRKINTTLILIVIGSLLVYLGILAWFEVNWVLAGILGVPGTLVLLLADPNGFEKSSDESAIEVIDGALLKASPRAQLESVNVTIRCLIDRLREARTVASIGAMRETILIWNPLYDAVVQLFAATVEGDAPWLRTGPNGKPLRNERGNHSIEGGWPCQQYPEGWQARAREILSDYQLQRTKHQLSGSPDRKKGNFALLRSYMRTCLVDSRSLSGADVGMIRLILASFATRRGLPGSSRHLALRRRQEGALPVLHDRSGDGLARVLISRLEELPPKAGLDSTEAVLAPVTPREAERFSSDIEAATPDGVGSPGTRCPRCGSSSTAAGIGPRSRGGISWLLCHGCGAIVARYQDGEFPCDYGLKAGQEIPRSLQALVRRSLRAPLTYLIEQGIISSRSDLAMAVWQLAPEVDLNSLVYSEDFLDAVTNRLAEKSPTALAVPSRPLRLILTSVMLAVVGGAVSLGVLLVVALNHPDSSEPSDYQKASTTEIEAAVDDFMVHEECERESATVEFDFTNEDYARVLYYRSGGRDSESRLPRPVEYRYYYATGSVARDTVSEFCF